MAFPPSKSAGQKPQGPPQAGGPPAPAAPPRPQMPPPGQGMDPFQAMSGGFSGAMGGATPAPPFPADPSGLPVGGAIPGMDANTGGSGLLESLLQSLSGPGPEQGLGEPTGGDDLQSMLLALALSQAGVQPEQGMQPGASGVPVDPGSDSSGLLQSLMGGGGGGY